MDYQQYIYEGPVEAFGVCIANKWFGKTFAPTEKKARSNLTYQFKKQFGKAPNTQITLPGKLVKVGKE